MDRGGKLPAALLTMAALWPWALLGGHPAQLVTLILGAATALWRVYRERFPISTPMRIVAVGLIGAIAMQVATGRDFAAQNYLLTALVALLIAAARLGNRMRTLLLVVLGVSVLMQGVEVAHDSYLYTVTTREILLDANLLRLDSGVLRAKGVFYGPVTAALFAVVVAVCYRGERKVWLLALASAAMAQGRLSVALLLIGAMAFGLRDKDGSPRRGRGLFAAAGAVIAGWYLLDVTVRRNYLATFDMTDRGNEGRLGYWSAGWDLYANSDVVTWLIGQPGATYAAFRNSSENDYLQALNETGLLGFALVAATVVVLALRTRNRWLLLLALGAFAAAGFASLSVGVALAVALALTPTEISATAGSGVGQRMPATDIPL